MTIDREETSFSETFRQRLAEKNQRCFGKTSKEHFSASEVFQRVQLQPCFSGYASSRDNGQIHLE